MIVRELLAVLGLQVDEDGFKRAEGLAGALKGALLAVGAAATATAAAIGTAVYQAANHAKEMRNLAETGGVSVDFFQRMAYAADTVGIEAGDLRDVFLDLSERIYDAASGAGEYADVFKAVGISAKDSSGQLKSSQVVLFELADAFAKMEDGSKKSAIASKLFGEQGARLLPALNTGRAGLEALGAEAEELGLVFDAAALQAGQEFAKGLHWLKSALHGLVLEVGRGFMPAAQKMLGAFREWWRVNRRVLSQKLPQLVESLTEAFKTAWQVARPWVAALFSLATNMEFLRRAAMALGAAIVLMAGAQIAAGVGALGQALAATKALTVAQLAAKASTLAVAGVWGLLALAVILAVEEVDVFRRGGQTVMGDWDAFLKRFAQQGAPGDPWWMTMLRTFAAFVLDLSTTWPRALAELGFIFEDWWKGIVWRLKQIPGELLDAAPGMLVDAIPGMRAALDLGTRAGSALFGGGAESPAAAATARGAGSTTSNVSVGEVTVVVPPGTPPAAVGAVVRTAVAQGAGDAAEKRAAMVGLRR